MFALPPADSFDGLCLRRSSARSWRRSRRNSYHPSDPLRKSYGTCPRRAPNSGLSLPSLPGANTIPVRLLADDVDLAAVHASAVFPATAEQSAEDARQCAAYAVAAFALEQAGDARKQFAYRVENGSLRFSGSLKASRTSLPITSAMSCPYVFERPALYPDRRSRRTRFRTESESPPPSAQRLPPLRSEISLSRSLALFERDRNVASRLRPAPL